MRKQTKVLLAAAALSVVFASTAYAGWNQDDRGYWYQREDGSIPKSGIREIDGQFYGFDLEGYMLKGWSYLNFKWYYFNPESGAQSRGWTQLDGKWYYLDPRDEGAMFTYWLDLDGKRYYLDESGALQTGLFYLSDPTQGSTFAYQADESGALIRNRKSPTSDGSKTFMYDADGVMRYSSDVTKQVSRITDEDEWQYVLNEADQKDQNLRNLQIVADAVQELKNDYYDRYRDNVSSQPSEKRAGRTRNWEKKAGKSLSYYLSEEEIQAYFDEVEDKKYVKKDVVTDYFEDEDEDYED